jgi:hypothetical protein
MKEYTRTRSFTLIELMVSMSLFVIIGLLLIYFVRNGYTIYNRGQIASLTKGESDMLTTRISNALRGTFQVLEATPTKIVVYSYYVPSDITPTKVTFEKINSTIVLTTIKGVAAGQTFAYDPATAQVRTITSNFVNNPSVPFLGYQSEDSILNTPININAVHLIEINLTIFSPSNSNYIYQSSTKVNLRNLKTNL